jgi:hypothetical protein
MAMDELAGRLTDAAAGMEALRPAVAAGEPWPLSDDYGTEPESEWGPKEVLAHVNEMLPYWLGQVEGILAVPAAASAADGAPPFGRVATDENRLARIGEDRSLPASELLDRIGGSAATVRSRLISLTPAELERSGTHPRLGEMTVPSIFERFVVSHLEEHVRQLTEVLARD